MSQQRQPHQRKEATGNLATRGLFLLDTALLQQLAANQWFTCRVCGQRFRGTDLEAALRHRLTHNDSVKARRDVEEVLSMLHDLERDPEALPHFLSNPATFDRLRREGAITRIAGEGPNDTDGGGAGAR